MNGQTNKQYVFKFECAKGWENLIETENKNIRQCERCNKNVHLVQSIGEFNANAEKGNCVYAPEMRTAGIPVYNVKPEEHNLEKSQKVGALPLWWRFIQLVISFIIAFPLVSFLPLFLQRTMTRSQTSGGDVIDYSWKFSTFYGFLADYKYFRPEEHFYFFLAVNFVLAVVYAFITALVIVLLIISRSSKKLKKKK